MEFVWGFFASSIVWWLVLAAECGALFFFVSKEMGFWPLASIILAAIFLGFSPLMFIESHPFWALVSPLIYAALGLVHLVYRWRLSGRKYQRDYNDAPDNEKEYLYKNWPTARAYKKKLFILWAYWPISLTLWVASEMLFDIFESIYRRIVVSLDQIMQGYKAEVVAPVKPDAKPSSGRSRPLDGTPAE